MQRRSAKQKGKRAVFQTRSVLLENAPQLQEEDVVRPVGSRKGADLILSPRAQSLYPYTLEIKNQERLNIWEALEQSERHAQGTDLTPLLVFRRNKSELYVSLRLEDFLRLTQEKRATGGPADTRPLAPALMTDRPVESEAQ